MKYTPLPIAFPSKKSSGKGLKLGGALIIAAVVVGGGLYVVRTKPQIFAKDATASAKKEAESLVKKVSRHLVLPQGEVPTIATVQNASRFKNKPFFNQAKNGDKLLVYARSHKIILYRPTDDKVVDVGFYNPEAAPEKSSKDSGEVSGAAASPTPSAPSPSPTSVPTIIPSPTP